MELYSKYINKLIEQFSKLPGVGSKSAQRLALHIINMPEEHVERFAQVMIDAKKNIHYCNTCYTLTDAQICPICANQGRDHVLHGAISPMLGVGPGDIKLKELIKRLEGDVREVIIATNSSLEGETTAMYISKLIKPSGIKVTRIASGVPVGGDLECIDEMTLLRALEGRTEL